VTKNKKNIFFVVKYLLITILLLVLILFFYAAFFFDPSSIEKKVVEKQIIKEENVKEKELKEEEERLKEEEILKEENKQKLQSETKIKKFKTTLKDGLFAIVENRAITQSDIVNEMKRILIINNLSYSEENKNELQQMAVKSVIKKTVKQIEISKNDFLEFNPSDLNFELNRIASQLGMDLETLKKICETNGLDFLLIEDYLKIDLLWNSLIFHFYKDRISVNLDEIDEQLKLNQNKKEFDEFLISEIVIKRVENAKLESEVSKLITAIENEGFEKVAMRSSISQTAINGGDLGWLNENKISKNFRSIIFNTPVGNISQPILLKDGVLIFKVRDKRRVKEEVDLEELKNQIINNEKTKILNMYSSTHYDNLRRSIAIKFFDE
tara:strand:+ start:1588 stop:2733 length:1146 start_codon:yes stop_codon:yes gene_type:complete